MPISIRRAQQHVADWTPKLPSRPWWPNHLFFAAHVTAAASIIQTGRLRCRRDLAGAIDHDVANQDALGTNPVAHNFVRLYFRTKTHFHLRTEGIKLSTDPYRLAAHMSVPVMFVFDFASVVTRPQVQFCDRKMAHVGIAPGNDEAYFNNIDFGSVYHDSGILDPARRAEVNDRRMAEVLVPDELPLDGSLKLILCRTNFEALTLQHILRAHDPAWRSKLRVATKPAEVFFCWGSFITDLQLAGDALTVKLKVSRDYRAGQKLKFNIQQRIPNQGSFEWAHDSVITNNPLLISGWNPAHPENWRIEIEDALAFEGAVQQVQTGTVVGP